MLLALLFMLMSPTVSLSQSRSKQKKQKYPAVRIENKDTVVVFSIKQTRAIDQSYKQLKLQLDSIKTACNVVVDSLNNKVSNLYTVNDSLYKSNLKLLSIVSLTTTKVDDTTYFYYYLDPKNKDKASAFNTWSLQANVNYGYGNFDRVSNDLFQTSMSSKVGFGLRATKQLSTVVAINFDLYRSNFEGQERNFTYYTKATQFSVLPQFQIGNIKFLESKPRTIFYGYAGLGVIKFTADPSTDKLGFVIPYGVGTKYKLSEKSAISLDFTLNYYLGDDLDGKEQLYSDNDTYNRFSLGYTYTFGNKGKKNLTWFNPFTDAYNRNFFLLK